jgi:hypothetical protein
MPTGRRIFNRPYTTKPNSVLKMLIERISCSDSTVFDPELRPKGARRNLVVWQAREK